MEIHDYVGDFRGQIRQDLIGGTERAVKVAHEHASYEVHHSNHRIRTAVQIHRSAWYLRRIIGGTQNARFFADIVVHFFLIPNVVAAREHVYAQGKQLLRHVPGEAESARRILAVGHNQDRFVLLHQIG